jgi:pre-mRNA-splicing factor CWC26
MSSKNDKRAYLAKYYGDRNKKHREKRKRSSVVDDVDLPDGARLHGDDRNEVNSRADEDDGPVVVETTNAGDQDKKRPNRTRHDSSLSEKESTPAHRPRHDSSDEEISSSRQTLVSKHRNNRSRIDSSSDDDTAKIPERQRSSNKVRTTNRRRYDSEEEDIPPKRYDSSSSDSSRERLSSGHVAGLQASKEFSQSQAKLTAKNQRHLAAMVDKHGYGETIYRDKSGRRVDKSTWTTGPEVDKLEQQRLLNTGKVQMDQEKARTLDFAKLQKSSFARHTDDAGLEALRKSAIRAGDPMASATVAQKQDDNMQQPGAPLRPVYKGPAAKANRYAIRPGFRWDGVDRGNGFEDKLLAKRYSTDHQKEKSYRWSTADM